MIPLPSKHLLITVVIVISSFFLLLWANERYSAYVAARDSRAEVEWNSAKENWKKVHQKISATLASAARADTIIRIEHIRAASALRVADSLRSARETVPLPTDSVSPRWRPLYYSALAEANSLRTVVRSDTVALRASEFSRDSLRAVLLLADTAGTKAVTAGQTLIDVRTCKVFWVIKCPSRKVVAVGGLAVGALSGAYVARHR
jgi:hypothetical protein